MYLIPFAFMYILLLFSINKFAMRVLLQKQLLNSGFIPLFVSRDIMASPSIILVFVDLNIHQILINTLQHWHCAVSSAKKRVRRGEISSLHLYEDIVLEFECIPQKSVF